MEKNTPSHGVLSDFGYVISILWQEYRIYLFICLAWALLLPVRGTIYPFISKYAMDAITEPRTRMFSVSVLAGLIALEAAAAIGNAFCTRYANSVGTTWVYWIFNRRLFRKRLSMDYQNMESTSANDSFQKAHNGVIFIGDCLGSMRLTFDGFARVVIYTIVLARLSPIMVLINAVPATLFFLGNRRAGSFLARNTDKWTGLDRQLDYINSAATDFSYAKDVRLYNMSHWLRHKFDEIWGNRIFWHQKYDRYVTGWRLVIDMLPMLSTLASYLLIIRRIFQGGIGAGDFVLYFTATQNYSNAIFQFADHVSGFYRLRDNINYYRDYLDIPDKFNHGEGAPLPEDLRELTFRNVSYTYPNADAPTIKNISFTLKKGEKLALVGLNGAGKSTLIKLMCGLYDPTEGEILLNGIDVRSFNREEYYALFATVFQDFDILPVTIAQNIAQTAQDIAAEQATGGDKLRVQDKPQQRIEVQGTSAKQGMSDKQDTPQGSDAEQITVAARVTDVLEKSGLSEKVAALPHGAQTLLAKSVYDDATDFSGGEMQKLALAKALYKDSPLLLLDEPTAAMDPISEQEMYLRYADFARDKFSVFISHRLASTRFCDEIMLIDDGRVLEQGTHAGLMEAGGRYAELFAIQSAYYRDEALQQSETARQIKEAAGV